MSYIATNAMGKGKNGKTRRLLVKYEVRRAFLEGDIGGKEPKQSEKVNHMDIL